MRNPIHYTSFKDTTVVVSTERALERAYDVLEKTAHLVPNPRPALARDGRAKVTPNNGLNIPRLKK